MKATIEKRLKAIEQAVKPFIPQKWVLIGAPSKSADQKAHESFRDKMEQAKAEGSKVIVLRGVKPGEREDHAEENGVHYFNHEVNASMFMLSNQPSLEGRQNRLADALFAPDVKTLGPQLEPSVQN